MIFPIPLVAFRRRSLNKVCSCFFCSRILRKIKVSAFSVVACWDPLAIFILWIVYLLPSPNLLQQHIHCVTWCKNLFLFFRVWLWGKNFSSLLPARVTPRKKENKRKKCRSGEKGCFRICKVVFASLNKLVAWTKWKWWLQPQILDKKICRIFLLT